MELTFSVSIFKNLDKFLSSSMFIGYFGFLREGLVLIEEVQSFKGLENS